MTTSNAVRASWLPMVAIAMGQALMSFNVAALPVSMGGMVDSFGVPPTTIGTAIIMYSMGVSGFVFLGAKLGQRFGAKLFFQASVTMFFIALLMVVFSPTAHILLLGQALAGLSGAALVPTLVVLIAHHYTGEQQAKAVGLLGSARAAAGVLAFLIIGSLERFVGWRAAFGLLLIHAIVILILSFKLKPTHSRPEVKIDVIGVILVASGIIILTLGVNNIRNWGLFFARPNAPFELLGLSPAPMFMAAGIFLISAFLAWTRRRETTGKTPLFAMQVINSSRERAAVLTLFIIVCMEAALNFSVPLYIQIVQGRSAFDTAIAMMPFNLTVFFTAFLVVKLYTLLTSRQIARIGFVLAAAGAYWLVFVVSNNWSSFPVMFGLITFGIGQGMLVTLLFNVLVTGSPKELAGDVGSLRGTTQNLAASVGTALMGALVVAVLSAGVMRNITADPVLTPELISQLDLENINFLSNDRLEERLKQTTATPEQIDAAIAVNETTRLRALKVAFAILGTLAVLAIFPCGMLPDYKPGEIPDEDAEPERSKA